jgi:hypothetical protein
MAHAHATLRHKESTAIQETEDTDAMQQLKAGDEGLHARRVRHRNICVTGPNWVV